MTRPTAYTADLGAAIADLHAEGQSITEISKRPDMPARKDILRWIAEHPEFDVMIDNAKAAYVDALAEECLSIANHDGEDFVKEQGKLGEDIFKFDRDAIQRSKLKIDTRLKLIEKWAPARYGKTRAAAAAGAGQAATATLSATAKAMSENELARRIIFAVDRARRGAPLPANMLQLQPPKDATG